MPSQALADERFRERLYAVLAAWGMSSRAAELSDYSELFRRAQALRDEIDVLASESLGALEQPAAVADTLWGLITRLRVSDTRSQLVAGSKFLHHLLPNLVPPMDRAYTGAFFCKHDLNSQTLVLQSRQDQWWRAMFCEFSRFAKQRREVIAPLIDGDWQTGVPKVIDNAIVGWVSTQKSR